jgi:hypothetical protein
VSAMMTKEGREVDMAVAGTFDKIRTTTIAGDRYRCADTVFGA